MKARADCVVVSATVWALPRQDLARRGGGQQRRDDDMLDAASSRRSKRAAGKGAVAAHADHRPATGSAVGGAEVRARRRWLARTGPKDRCDQALSRLVVEGAERNDLHSAQAGDMSAQGYDAVVIDGGPAGCGRPHARPGGASVAWIEQTQYEDLRWGETLSPSVRAPLQTLGVWQRFTRANHLPSLAVVSYWGPRRWRTATTPSIRPERCGTSIAAASIRCSRMSAPVGVSISGMRARWRPTAIPRAGTW